MYITDRYLCFHSRIISYVTKHVYRWEQIENVTKERVAFIFPTAIGIQLKPTRKKIIYASFLQRDQAYDKILSMCSRFSNDTSSYQDDDENSSTQSGTLKANHRNSQDKSKKSKHQNHFDMPDEIEQEDVLQLCLRDDKIHNKRLTCSLTSKTSDDKQQSKKFNYSDKQKQLSKKTSTNDQSLNNKQANRTSRSTSRNQQKQSDGSLSKRFRFFKR